jgi:hypothetical protein
VPSATEGSIRKSIASEYPIARLTTKTRHGHTVGALNRGNQTVRRSAGEEGRGNDSVTHIGEGREREDVEEVVGNFYKLPPGRRSEMSKQRIETKKETRKPVSAALM